VSVLICTGSGASVLVQICPSYVDLERESGGGVSNLVRHISLHLAEMERNVLVLCGDRNLGQKVAKLDRLFIDDKLSVEVFPQLPHPVLGPTHKLHQRIRNLPPGSVAHVHTCFSAFTEAAMAALWKQRVPFVFTPHGKFSPLMLGRHKSIKRLWWHLFTKRYVRRARVIALSSPAEIEYCRQLGLRQDFEIVHNGYDIPKEHTVSGPPPPRAEPYILYLGYLDPRKQPEFLVKAFAESKARRTHELILAGSDDYGHGAVVRQTIEDCRLGDRVVFWGPAYGADKWNLFRHASCLCLPSQGEGMPLILCEALGAGLPTIYSSACNFPEIAARGAGVEISGWSVETWATALDRVCLDRDRQLALRMAAKGMSADYTWETVSRKWCELYDNKVFHTSCKPA
jgi:glycosyltransferase involved in cell wall biosynthesis